MKEFKVGVFENTDYPKRQPNAYTIFFNPDWTGCCEHTVTARNGTEAKRLAIKEHQTCCKNTHKRAT